MKNLFILIAALFSLVSNVFATETEKEIVGFSRNESSAPTVEIKDNKYIMTQEVSITLHYSNGETETSSTTLRYEVVRYEIENIQIQLPKHRRSYVAAVISYDNGVSVYDGNGLWKYYSYDEPDRCSDDGQVVIKQAKEEKKERKPFFTGIIFKEGLLPEDLRKYLKVASNNKNKYF